MYFHRTYGLNIQTDLLLPELGPEKVPTLSKDQVDVVVRFGKAGSLPAAVNGVGRYIQSTPEGIQLRWDNIGAFLVRNGREIIIEPAPGVEESLLRLFILGTSLAMLLHQRGEAIILHASVVKVSGQAVAFVGVKGQGKSTMAATLHARGHHLVADDILAIDLRRPKPLALPGFPYLKLWPDALASLGFSPESLPRLRPELDKRGYRLPKGFSYTSVPLRRIFVLNHGSKLAVEPLHPRDALFSLMPHWYGSRFGIETLRALGLATHFLECAELISKVSVCRLTRPEDLSILPAVARLVEENL